MKRYIKEHIILPANQITIIKNGMQILNPPEDMLLQEGWKEYVTPEPSEKDLLIRAIYSKKEKIFNYDSSEAINEFTINGTSMWLDKATRVGLKLRFDSEIESGRSETTLWHNGISFTLNLTDAVKMLHAIEIYASECYDNTQRHIGNIAKLTQISEIEAYDYQTGYPTKLEFNM